MGDSYESKAIAVFDQLVSDGVLVYGPHESVVHEAESYPVQFKVCEHLSKKPHTVGAKLSPAFDKSRKWGPGSDMYCPDERLILGRLNGTHDLALNLFCVDKPQLLMLTLDSYRRQHQPLDRDDLQAALEVVRRFPSMYVIYNCSEAGGCSRTHKHLQGLRGPPFAFEHVIQASEGKATVPFRFFLHHFSQGFAIVSAKEVLDVYLKLLEQTRNLLNVSSDDVCPHNIVMWKDWLIVIPRRAGFTEGASANAGGMMGCVWVPEHKNIEEWERIGYANVLRQLGVPS
ncbi:tetraphosphate phosphorylase 2 (ATP adenylyltransferase) [Stagonosporopsis vannaccii]|nr:tetraphosphate phosphorylase 2 (ATP adenylyltransferase) [Stagonosporopsis vannaccii]